MAKRRDPRRQKLKRREPVCRAELVVERLGHQGDGVAMCDGKPVFVPLSLAGERVEADVKGDRAEIVRILEPAPERVTPPCPAYGDCGGCAAQHMTAEAYLAWKRDIVVTAFRNRGIETDVRPLVDAHGAGRRRAAIHVRNAGGGKVSVGFNRRRGREVVDLEECLLLCPELSGAFDLGHAVANALGVSSRGLDLRLTATDTGVDLDVAGADEPDLDARETLVRIADEHDLARLSLAGETVAERRRPTFRAGSLDLTPPAGGFLQATGAGEAALGRLVLDAMPDDGTVADLFCGAGPFALRLAERHAVLASDSDAAALAALEGALRTAPGLKPVRIERRDLFDRPFMADEMTDCMAAVFDPPRAGAEVQARELAASAVPVIVGVSCNPVTFARDAEILIQGGYRLEAVTPVDQFRYAAHVELVGVFRRA